MNKFVTLPLAICAAAAFAFAPASNASIIQVWDLTSDHCTGGCLGGTLGGTVKVTDNGTGTLIFDVELLNGNQFINSGFNASFGFNLLGIPSITYSGIDPSADYTIPGGNPQSSGSLHMDGTGFFQFGLDGIGNGGSDPLGSSLKFTIAAAGLDITDLTQNALSQFFAADIISGTQCNSDGCNTGAIDASNGPHNESPEPGSLLLLGIGIAALGLARRRMSART